MYGRVRENTRAEIFRHLCLTSFANGSKLALVTTTPLPTERAALSETQARTLVKLEQSIRAEGVSPSLNELAALCGVSRSSVRETLDRLARDGYVTTKQNSHRSLALTQRGWKAVAEQLSSTNPA